MLTVFSIIKTFWTKWKLIAEKIGNFQFSVIFSIFYFFLVTPLGLVTSLFNDFLNLRGQPTWVSKKSDSATLAELKKQ